MSNKVWGHFGHSKKYTNSNAKFLFLEKNLKTQKPNK